MKFIFKEQDYQIAAVKAVTDVFAGQRYQALSQYTRDLGKLSPKDRTKGQQLTLDLGLDNKNDLLVAGNDNRDDISIGFANAPIEIDDSQALKNIQNIQMKSNLAVDNHLSKILSPLDLDVEMETGTGKTYVYIRTMFELNKLYGFSKFIVMVPSIAIREGVKKSFEQTQEHFMSIYGKKARFFIYNSANLTEIDNFAKDSSIEVMIINIQAFNTRGKDGRKIYEELDEFQSRKPIDVIKKTRPILILDEPQKMSGDATKSSIGEFNPLFTINYSATHKEKHNLVYVLDALDAYNAKLVKKIQVKAVKVDNVKGTQDFLYLEDIILRGDKDPQAKISFFRNTKQGVKPYTQLLNRQDNIYELSGFDSTSRLSVYKNNYIVDEIDYNTNTVKLLNGIVLHAGEVIGDNSEDLIRRIQIRETIASHLEKEQDNFHKGIKTLSLFFIDEVKKYRDYSQPDEKGEYAKIFEEEYKWAVVNFCNDLTNTDEEYKNYLQQFTPDQVHKGYFSIDKKGHAIDSKADRKTGLSDDQSAYDLILKNKERLLSFDEPTRFIFSHSALREGWDNPNVFQICFLRHTKSETQKRQEVGRGLRIAVDKNGNRQDATVLSDFFGVNKLTVIANEEYESFVKGLQSEIKEVLYKHPTKADKDFFFGKPITNAETGVTSNITDAQARLIYKYLNKYEYVDDSDNLTEAFRNAVDHSTLAEMPDELKPYQSSIIELANSIHKGGTYEIENGKKPKVIENKVNQNFDRKEFKELWNSINHKYSYRVSFSSDELTNNCIQRIKKDLDVSKITYSVDVGEQKDAIAQKDIDNSFERGANSGKKEKLHISAPTSAKYDLVHEIAQRTHLTRRTIVRILVGTKEKLQLFRDNPEEYITKISNLIDDEKAAVIVRGIRYNKIEGRFDDTIFNEKHADYDSKKAFPSKKAIQNYVFVDGTAKDGESNEMKFARNLEQQENVKVYAKMPKGFYIPTPMGRYSPDWAIVYESDNEKGVYFIAETKGSLDSLSLRKIEESKIDCAKSLYNQPSSKVNYGLVHTYDNLVTKVMDILEKHNGEQS